MQDNLYIYRAKITRIVDGDTIVADIDLGFSVVLEKQIFRLSRINAPEMKEPTMLLALTSKDALSSKILGKDVVVKTKKDSHDKYGRYLAEIFLGEENINDWLLSEKYALPYKA